GALAAKRHATTAMLFGPIIDLRADSPSVGRDIATRGDSRGVGRAGAPTASQIHPDEVDGQPVAAPTAAAAALRAPPLCHPPRTWPCGLSILGSPAADPAVWVLPVSPDLDPVTYALAGLLGVARGWGRADETFRCLEAMAAHGAPTWFSLGDRDLATHLTR